jgi:thioesterase domain-containing protein/acyl carrier protein
MRPLRLSNFTFSGHHTSLFSALLQGVTLCYYNVKEDGFIGLSDWMREQQVTSFQATATVFRSWVSTLSPEDQFPSVMVASAGGERKLHEDIAALKRHFPNLQFIRMGFASTETQSVASALFPPDHDFPEGELPAGIPVDWVKVYIWDEDGNEVPKGAPGEIVVYSDTLVRGYINNPELTQKQFIPDPDNPNFQYYKTRDRGRFREDGQLIHMGRVDNMVKLKGVRIELTTIEAQIMAYPGIVQVGCNVFEDKNGNKKLAAYFVADQGLTVPVSDLRTFMARKLPLHMLPHFYIQMDSFPTTRTNKLDRHQLPQPQMTRPELANEYVPPVDETEKKLVDIWEDVIGIEGIGVTDDFFEVGGDSLIGVILFIEIERQFDRNLPVSVLLTASTIRKQAELISNPQTEEASSSIIEINPRGEKLPVLFIPGKGGYPTRIRHLARKLDAETPVYALQDIAEGRTDGSLRRIESVAAYYINEIRKVVPHGPYILLGESMGGMIAYEMANQLREFDEHPSIVGLLDTYNMGAENYMNKALSYYWLMIQKHVNILVRSDWEGRFDYFTFYRESFFKKVADEIRRYTNRNTRHASNLPRHISDLENANVRAAHKYAPGEYPGPVILFKALRGPHREYPMNGWEKVNIGQFVVHEIDCYHGSILFEPAVSELAAILSDYTENKAQGNHA